MPESEWLRAVHAYCRRTGEDPREILVALVATINVYTPEAVTSALGRLEETYPGLSRPRQGGDDAPGTP